MYYNEIMRAFHMIRKISDLYDFKPDNNDYFGSILRSAKSYFSECDDNITIIVRKDIEDYLYDEFKISDINHYVYRILNPDAPKDIEIENIEKYVLSFLSNRQLMQYLIAMFMTVTFNQNCNLVLLKYNICIWNTGWSNFAKQCRGKIVDMDGYIVSYAFDKFFNLSEVPETSYDVVQEALKNSTYVYATEKKDGSTIIFTKTSTSYLLTTNGSFDNEQISEAKKIIEEKYTDFVDSMPEYKTFIFEIIYPENRIVVDYGDERDLYLLAIRDLNTLKLLPIEDVHKVAKKYGFPVPKLYDFTSLDDFVKIATETTGANREGWVFRIGNDYGEIMVKLKFREYFEMHKVETNLSIFKVYNMLTNGFLDDYMVMLTDLQKLNVTMYLDEIAMIREEIEKNVISESKKFLEFHKITHEDFTKDYQKMVGYIVEILSGKNIYKNYIVNYLKDSSRIENDIQRIKPNKFKIYARLLHPEKYD